MWHRRCISLLFGFLMLCVAFCTSCNSKSLTRSTAMRLLNNSKQVAQGMSEIRPSYAALDLAQKDGFFNGYGEFTSEKARDYFAKYSIGPIPIATLKKPLVIKMTEITGISDNGNSGRTKLVDFRWVFNEVPAYVERYTGLTTRPRDGKAVLELYDDGWRVEDIDFDLVDQM